MKEITTYRLIGSGVWGYEFYDSDRNQIGFVRNGLSNSEPVRIAGEGIDWYSRFGLDTTIVPGTGRKVKDNRNGFRRQGRRFCRISGRLSMRL